jgi:hypothetical protein
MQPAVTQSRSHAVTQSRSHAVTQSRSHAVTQSRTNISNACLRLEVTREKQTALVACVESGAPGSSTVWQHPPPRDVRARVVPVTPGGEQVNIPVHPGHADIHGALHSSHIRVHTRGVSSKHAPPGRKSRTLRRCAPSGGTSALPTCKAWTPRSIPHTSLTLGD